MPQVTLLCLANSRKPPSGRCIAGKIVAGGATHAAWIRPVSARPTHEVSEDERRYENGARAQLLDIITLHLLQASPSGHQVENHVLDDRHPWEKVGVATWAQVLASVDPHDNNFWSNSQSTYHGLNDKVSETAAASINSSLKLIHVSDLIVSVQVEDGFDGAPGRRRVRAKFTMHGTEYWMSITDPEIETQYLALPNAEHNVGQAVLCISLAEVWHGFAFRVVASVLTPARFG